ncbi:hypothetical protein D3C80_1979640 [compost metagenome]
MVLAGFSGGDHYAYLRILQSNEADRFEGYAGLLDGQPAGIDYEPAGARFCGGAILWYR